ncbi:beta-propeller domain-containing protein [Ilumatobacter sp.]|uniref:beta-propeller domain-containing protein n=1 Tax=Ilumatobacter sp. TaxID=1967498 RepID=UPI003AF5BD5C
MRAAPILLASLALTASACSANGGSAAPDVTGTRPSTSDSTLPTDDTVDVGDRGSGIKFRRALTPFDDCSAFLDHVQAEARSRVGPYGLDGDPWAYWLEGDVVMGGDEATVEMAEEAASDASAAPGGRFSAESASGDDDGGPSYTGTNVQELGVDEPDIVKTDGDRIIAVSENRLTHIDITGEPVVTDVIDLPEGWGHELFIRGDRALLFTNGGQWAQPLPVDVVDETDAEAEFAAEEELSIIAPDHFTPVAVIHEVDLSDPNDLEVAATMRIEGQYLSARAIGERVRLVVTSPPNQLPWLYPQNQYGEDRATDANRRVVDESTIDDWIPSYELTTGGTTTSAPMLSCDRTHRPVEFSGFDVISIVDLDLAAGLGGSVERTEAVGVMAGGDTVYSSTERMYVATTKWAGADVVKDATRLSEWNDEYETDLHAFAISPGEPTRYVASGTVEGSLLNQFSLDEHEGFLRVITTTGSPWNRQQTSESHLVVLEEQDDRLTTVGEVGGLGKGELLHSARLMGDVGFAVTFRQIDPFYVLDLSDPTNPRITGELKIPGVSTYLHPVGDDRVLGVGQQATEDGRTTGLKLSLFDVSDPAAPREVSVWTLEGAHSPAEWDHRAFQMWDTTAIVPAQTWDERFNGAVLFDIGGGITEIGRVSHSADAVPSSDCRTLTTDDVPEDSELWWMVNEASAHVQVCEETDRGGFGNWVCEQFPLDDVQYWIGDPEVADDVISGLGDDGDRIEMCWPDGGYQEAIQRSLVVDGTLWTMTPSTIQATALDGLTALTQLPLR